MADISLNRLRKEFRDIRKNPPPFIRAAPLEKNILEWHYVIEGAKGTPYENGWYHGVLLFPKDYPYKPPSVLMYTPNGRFKEATRLCLSMSDFHPELWNTTWSVATILVGLQSFMNEDTPTAGSMTTTSRARRQYALKTMQFNVKNKKFCNLFPELVDMYKEQQAEINSDPSSVMSADSSMGDHDGDVDLNEWSMDSVLLMLVSVLICVVAIVMMVKSEGS